MKTQKWYHDARTVHAILACLAWVIFFPLGAILMRVLSGRRTWLVHAGVQIFAAAFFTVAVALGIILAKKYHALMNYHVLIGLVLFGMMWIQSILGYLQHTLYQRYLRRTIFGHAHVWLGYPVITLAMINGGLGLLWSKNATRGQCIAYGVVTAMIWICWITTVIVVGGKRMKTADVDEKSGSASESEIVNDTRPRRQHGYVNHNNNIDAERSLSDHHGNEHTVFNDATTVPSISRPDNVAPVPAFGIHRSPSTNSRTRTYIIEARR